MVRRTGQRLKNKSCKGTFYGGLVHWAGTWIVVCIAVWIHLTTWEEIVQQEGQIVHELMLITNWLYYLPGLVPSLCYALMGTPERLIYFLGPGQGKEKRQCQHTTRHSRYLSFFCILFLAQDIHKEFCLAKWPVNFGNKILYQLVLGFGLERVPYR